MLRGKIKRYKNASNKNNLVIDGTLLSQNNITLRQSCIEKYNLKEGDEVIYDGKPYETVFVYEVVKRAENKFAD